MRIGNTILIIFIIGLFLGVGIPPNILTYHLKADLTDDLIGYWDFDSIYYNELKWYTYDKSENSYDGQLKPTSRLIGPQLVNGKVHKAIQFEDENEYVSIDSSRFDDHIDTYFRIECWIYWKGSSTDGIIFDARDYDTYGIEGSGRGFVFFINTKNSLTMRLLNTVGSNICVSQSNIPLNQWTHVIAEYHYENQCINLFINHKLDATNTINNSYLDTNVDPVIGNNRFAPEDGKWKAFYGVIDELKIYKSGEVNQPPYSPSNPSPQHGNSSVEMNDIYLEWEGGDPNSKDTVKYDIYLDISNPPKLLATGIYSSNYHINQLQPNTTYFWRVIAKDSVNESMGESLWEFTTKSLMNNNPPEQPVLNGPEKGKRKNNLEFTIIGTDPEKDSLQFIIDWGDGSIDGTEYVSSGNPYELSHNWKKEGGYTIQYYSVDSYYNITNLTSIIKYYNISIGIEIEDIGYVLDMDDDGIFDTFHNDQSGIENSIKMIKKDLYELDIDNDSIVDHLYSSSTDILEPIVEKESINMLWFSSIALMIIVFIFSLIIFYLKGRKNKQNETIHKDTSIVVNGNSTIQKCCVCLGRMKGGYSVVKCHCGNLFHKSCIERIGKCPNCSRVYTKVENEKE